jgi:hypothetical protein
MAFFASLALVAAPTLYLYWRLKPRLEIPPDGPAPELPDSPDSPDSSESSESPTPNNQAGPAYLAIFRAALHMREGLAEEQAKRSNVRLPFMKGLFRRPRRRPYQHRPLADRPPLGGERR